MPISPADALPAPVAPEGAPAGRTDQVYARQWKKALEAAQWNADTAHGHGDAAGRRPGASTSAAPARTVHALLAKGEPQSAGSGIARAVSVAPSVAGLGDAIARTALVALRLSADGESPQFTGASSDPAAQAPRIARGVPLAGAGQPVRLVAWQPLPEWPQCVVQASLTPAGVSIALRDASLDDTDALALYYRLRDRLREAGRELASFIVNGRDVAPPAPERAET